MQNKKLIDIAKILGSSSIGTIITIMLTPLITRLYAPESFGATAILISIISIIGPIGGLTYEHAIGISKSNNESRNILRLSIKLAAASSILTLAIFYIFIEYYPINNSLENHQEIILLSPLTIFFIVSNQALLQWCIRFRKYNPLNTSEISYSLITNTLKIIGGSIAPSTATLASITIIGYSIRPAILYLILRKKNTIYRSKINFYIDKELIKKYIRFPLYKAPFITASTIASNFPVLILGSYFGASASGLYGLTNSAVRQPINMVSNSFAKILQPDIYDLILNNKIKNDSLLRISKKLAAIGIIPLVLGVYFSPIIFSTVFGKEWGDAGKYTQWILIKEYIGFISGPYLIATNALNLQKQNLFIEIIFTALSILSLIAVSAYYKNDLYAVAVYSCINCIKDFSVNLATSRRIRRNNEYIKQ